VLEERGGTTATVTRAEKSMNALYTVYGAGMASLLVLTNAATGIEGNRVALIVVDFLCLTYLFFFSTWFRNTWFFPMMQRLRTD
jgi:hypothetical protein